MKTNTAPARGSRGAVLAAAATAFFALASCLTAPPISRPARLHVMSWNTGDAIGVSPSAEAVVEVLASLPSQDVYLLQEVLSPEKARAIVQGVRACGGGPYQLAYNHDLALAVLTRAAVEAEASFVAPSSPLRRGAMMVRQRSGGRLVSLVDVHLDPIPKKRDASGSVDAGLLRALGMVLHESFTANSRSDSVSEIIGWLDGLAGDTPLVIGGDFNTVPSSWAIRLMNERFVDAEASTGHPGGTYRRVHLPFLPRVDFVFVSRSLGVRSARTVRRTAGDHYPVLATLEIP